LRHRGGRSNVPAPVRGGSGISQRVWVAGAVWRESEVRGWEGARGDCSLIAQKLGPRPMPERSRSSGAWRRFDHGLCLPSCEWLESRLGRTFPLTLIQPSPEEGIGEEGELFDFVPGSTRWAGAESGVSRRVSHQWSRGGEAGGAAVASTHSSLTRYGHATGQHAGAVALAPASAAAPRVGLIAPSAGRLDPERLTRTQQTGRDGATGFGRPGRHVRPKDQSWISDSGITQSSVRNGPRGRPLSV